MKFSFSGWICRLDLQVRCAYWRWVSKKRHIVHLRRSAFAAGWGLSLPPSLSLSLSLSLTHTHTTHTHTPQTHTTHTTLTHTHTHTGVTEWCQMVQNAMCRLDLPLCVQYRYTLKCTHSTHSTQNTRNAQNTHKHTPHTFSSHTHTHTHTQGNTNESHATSHESQEDLEEIVIYEVCLATQPKP